MPRLRRQKQPSMGQGQEAGDDPIVPVLRRDMSGGMNSRMFENIIAENQGVLLQNILLETAGQRTLRLGQTRVDASYPSSPAKGYGLFGF